MAAFWTPWNLLLHYLLSHRVSLLCSPKEMLLGNQLGFCKFLVSINLWICFSFWVFHIAITKCFTAWLWKGLIKPYTKLFYGIIMYHYIIKHLYGSFCAYCEMLSTTTVKELSLWSVHLKPITVHPFFTLPIGILLIDLWCPFSSLGLLDLKLHFSVWSSAEAIMLTPCGMWSTRVLE